MKYILIPKHEIYKHDNSNIRYIKSQTTYIKGTSW